MSEKTEKPTQKKLDDARKDGNLLHSEEIVQYATFCCLLLYFFSAGPWMIQQLGDFLLTPARTSGAFEQRLAGMTALAWPACAIVLPLLLTQMLSGIAGNLLQKGMNFVVKSVTPSLKSLNVASNVKEMFSAKGLVKLLQSICKLLLLVSVCLLLLRAYLPDLLKLAGREVDIVLPLVGRLAGIFCLLACIGLFPFALFDFVWQKYQHVKKLKMEKRDVTQESKETNGNPEIKARRSEQHRELLGEDVKKKIEQSTLIVTNPTHLAVGLRYRQGETPLPQVTLSERGERAHLVREYAQEHHIPLVENISVARGLYRTVKPGSYIPVAMIDEIAEILATLSALDTSPDASPDADPYPHSCQP